MGKGIIIDNLGAARYNIQLVYDRARVTKAIARLDADILQAQQQLAVEGLSAAEAARLKAEIAALRLRKKLLGEMPADIYLPAWCADYSDDLTGEVGTIEVPGERDGVNIQPGFNENAVYAAARDGVLQHALAGTPESVFCNWAMLPGWQKFKPTYRYGTILELEIAAVQEQGDYATVRLDEAASSVKDLAINQTDILYHVPIDYMCCNGAGFAVDDEVIVAFDNQDWERPRIIGYKEEPKPCHEHVVFKINMEGEDIAVMVWDPRHNEARIEPCAPTAAAYVAWRENRETTGQDLFGTEALCGRETPSPHEDWLFYIYSREPKTLEGWWYYYALVFPDDFSWFLEATKELAAGCPDLSALSDSAENNNELTRISDGILYNYTPNFIGTVDAGWIIEAAYRQETYYSSSFYPGVAEIYPMTIKRAVLLPQSPVAVAGLRTKREHTATGLCLANYNNYDEQNDALDTFYSPFGNMGSYNNSFAKGKKRTLMFDGPPAEWEDWTRYYGEGSFIPCWNKLPDLLVAGQDPPDIVWYGRALPWALWTDPDDWRPDAQKKVKEIEAYALNRIWFDYALEGQYSEQVIADLCLVQYTPCTGSFFDKQEINYDPFSVEYTREVSYEFGTREILVHAQALYRRQGVAGVDFVAAGRDEALEAKIIEAIEFAYTQAEVPVNEIRALTIGVEIVR